MKRLTVLGLGILVMAACKAKEEQVMAPLAEPGPASAGVSAATDGPWTVKIEPLRGGPIAGELRLARADGQVRVTGEVRGLAANSEHGIHIHENGDCGNNGDAAGAHWNPTTHEHGGPAGEARHAGDLGNLKADAQGVAVVDVSVPMPLDAQVSGRAVVVHAKADDLKTQPSGNSGAREGCGVIGAGM